MFYSGPLTCLKRKEDVILMSRLFKFPLSGSKEMAFWQKCIFNGQFNNLMALIKLCTVLMQGYFTKLPLVISGNISLVEIKCSFLKSAKWLCCKIWVNQHSSCLHILCIVILVFLYLTKPFPPFIDRWKSPCAFLLWGYCMSPDSPLSLTRLLFWHALYRLKLELRVHMQVESCPLRSSFQKWLWRDMKSGIIN